MTPCFSAAGLGPRIIPAGFDVPLGLAPFDPALRGTHGPEYVEGSQRLEFLTGFMKPLRAELMNRPPPERR
jgi:hypothetical protein